STGPSRWMKRMTYATRLKDHSPPRGSILPMSIRNHMRKSKKQMTRHLLFHNLHRYNIFFYCDDSVILLFIYTMIQSHLVPVTALFDILEQIFMFIELPVIFFSEFLAFGGVMIEPFTQV